MKLYQTIALHQYILHCTVHLGDDGEKILYLDLENYLLDSGSLILERPINISDALHWMETQTRTHSSILKNSSLYNIYVPRKSKTNHSMIHHTIIKYSIITIHFYIELAVPRKSPNKQIRSSSLYSLILSLCNY